MTTSCELLSDPSHSITRIVATAGPKSYHNLENILQWGTIRINLSFVRTPEEVALRSADARRMRANSGDRICIMLDAVGPRVKLGPQPAEGIPIVKGESRIIQSMPNANDRIMTTAEPGSIIWSHFPLHKYVQPGERILLAEGKYSCTVVRVVGDQVTVTMNETGMLKKRGLNLPETDLGDLSALSDEDKVIIQAMLAQCDADMIALSFVRGPQDVHTLREFLASINKSHVLIMSKIETYSAAVTQLEKVAEVSDAMMVARGDLWCELRDPWTLPFVTLNIIRAGRKYGIPVITATQVCSSMQNQAVPSRAETDELYFLLSEGTDCLMGSEEFGNGDFPAETAAAFRKMGELVGAHARSLRVAGTPIEGHRYEPINIPLAPVTQSAPTATDPAQIAACLSWLNASPRVGCIVVVSIGGKSARAVYRHRPLKPLVVVTNNQRTARYFQQLQLAIVMAPFTEIEDESDVARRALSVLPRGMFFAHESTALLLTHNRRTVNAAGLALYRLEEIPL